MSDFYEDGFNRVRGPFVGHNKLGLREREDEPVIIATEAAPPLDSVIGMSDRVRERRKRVERYQRPCRGCDGGKLPIIAIAADELARCPVCHGRGTVTDERPVADEAGQ